MWHVLQALNACFCKFILVKLMMLGNFIPEVSYKVAPCLEGLHQSGPGPASKCPAQQLLLCALLHAVQMPSLKPALSMALLHLSSQGVAHVQQHGDLPCSLPPCCKGPHLPAAHIMSQNAIASVSGLMLADASGRKIWRKSVRMPDTLWAMSVIG